LKVRFERCYSTGHESVGGACITALKFFFDGGKRIRPLLNAAGREVAVPSSDGLSLNTYTGADRDSLDINGELNKLAYNISFGHGIHAGIHFRSSSNWSILSGRASCPGHLAGSRQWLQRAVYDQHHQVRRHNRDNYQPSEAWELTRSAARETSAALSASLSELSVSTLVIPGIIPAAIDTLR
jgi:hypothetical protein